MSCVFSLTCRSRIGPKLASRGITSRYNSSLASPFSTGTTASAYEEETLPAPTGSNTITVSPTADASPTATPNATHQPQQNHHDLPSFLAYADRVGLPTTSTVYVGTHYEYTVLESLSRFGVNLSRIGGRSDHGVDLVGHWTLPIPHPPVPTTLLPSSRSSSSPPKMRMLVQCKSLHRRPGPYLIRELEGAFNGAPVGYLRGTTGSSVLGLLAAPKEATAGVREAMGRSRLPLLFAMIGNMDGRVMQLLWNQRAKDVGLDGLGVGVRYCSNVDEDGDEKEDVKREVALTWKGNVLPYLKTSS
ncbi:MAG: hypothetical protein M1823_001506 [Watsoniomyces obsoletus]|nr:MAG: hypothetical protein M1823_001506 [Watsoniomyces obsoletus]